MIPLTKLLQVTARAAAAWLAVGWLPLSAVAAQPPDGGPEFRGALLNAAQVTAARLDELHEAGVRSVVLYLQDGSGQRAAEQQACRKIRAARLELYYWIEVARCAEMATAHPEWMASLQGHRQWRRLFANPPTPDADEVVKTFPWVPILNKEPFEAQRDRVRGLLRDRLPARGIFLNDLQGGPSACGCGNHLCRWTTDYGDVRTATPLGNGAPGAFVAAVRQLAPESRIIPVWTTECEEHDGAADGLCAGVGCFRGICWRAYTEQLMPVARESETPGVLLPYRDWQRDLPIYGQPAGWIEAAVRSFATMPVRHQGESIPASRLIAVVQGWDVTKQQIAQQLAAARRAGTHGFLVAYAEIDQSWQPRLHRWK